MPTFYFHFKVNGTLTDATSVTLSNSDATIGVIRNDTSASVVSPGTAYTHVSTGIYSYTFSAPANGLEYTRWTKAVYAGTPYYFEKVFTDAGSGASGTYCDGDDLIAMQGETNITTLSNQENDTTTIDYTRIQLALDQVDSDLNNWLRVRGYSYPLSQSSANWNDFNLTATRMAIILLYQWRGARDEQGHDRVGELKQQVDDTLRRLAIPGRLDAAQRLDPTVPTGPVGVIV